MEELKELKGEDIKKLLEEVIRNPEKFKVESKYLLEITLLTRHSGVFPHWREMKVIQGHPEIIKLDNYTEYDIEYDIMLIIPRKIGTIVKVFEYERLSEEEVQETEEYHIFTVNGWVSVRVK